MNDDPLPYLLLIVLFVLLSAFFSATETAFNSLSKTRLKSLAEKGSKRAEKTLTLSDRYGKLLTTILVGNNVVNIAMASVSTLLFIRILPNYGATVSTIVITVVVLIFGEISPKTVAKENPERFAMAVTPIMSVLVTILTPINFLFSKWQNLLGRIFKLGGNEAMTEDELKMLVEEVEDEGSIDKDEGNLLKGVLSFDEQTAQDVLTPRVDMECVSIDATKEEIAEVFSSSRYSRLPVCQGSADHIVGILYQKDFYTGNGISSVPVRELMREPVFVPHSIPIDDLLRIFQDRKSHIAVVTDEFGGTMGIVTMEDILEEIVGEIWDEHDEEVSLFQETAPGKTRVLCSADKDQFEEYFDRKIPSDSATVSGWVMEQLESIPSIGDSFTYEDLTITVTKTDSHRVREIEVTDSSQ